MTKEMYNIKLLFTNNPIEETINYIIERTYIQNSFTPICSKLIFRRFLVTLATECTFKSNKRFLKQVNGSTVIGPLSVHHLLLLMTFIWSEWKTML